MSVTKFTATSKTDTTPKAKTGTTEPVDLSSANVAAPDQANELQPVNLRGRFAVALCRAHRIAAEDGSTPCQDGLACAKQDTCLDLADKTLSYARDLNSGRSG